jgi:hypothetical protein
MSRMFFSLGFWMTIILFIALGYALRSAIGADCPGSNCGNQQSTFASSLQSTGRSPQSDLRAGNLAVVDRCARQTTPRADDLSFRQFANLQAGELTYAPGLSFTMTDHPDRVAVCPGPIEIPPRY